MQKYFQFIAVESKNVQLNFFTFEMYKKIYNFHYGVTDGSLHEMLSGFKNDSDV